MVAILGEYHTLYFVRLSSVTEMHFRSLPFQIGDKHVPVSTSADLRFKDVVKLVLCLIRLFQSVTFDILLRRSCLSDMVLPLLSMRLKAIISNMDISVRL